MSKTLGMRWLVVAAGAAMLLVLAAACGTDTKTIEVPGETVVVEKEVIKEVEVPGETVVVEKEVIKEVEVPGETVVVEKEVVKEVQVPGETVVVEKEVVKEVIKMVAGPEKVVVKEVPLGYVTDPTTGKAVTKPQYGGTLTTVRTWMGPHTDTFYRPNASIFVSGVIERPAMLDWAIDRDVWHLASSYYPPEYLVPHLAEWEQPDPLTVILHVRKGVHWHDKPPMNGRELTADDFVYNFHRVTGTGSGFTEPAAYAAFGGYSVIESITATDKYTVEIKLKEDVTGKTFYLGFNIAQVIAASFYSNIYPPEVIEEHGDAKDWRTIVGTGPYELTDLVMESSVTYKKNPNYWGYDPKYPEYRLPYIDEMRVLYMPEVATFISALRTGKVDFVGIETRIRSIDQAVSLMRTNPEIVLTKFWKGSNNSFAFSLTKEPFDDIRVRQAMQMALDHETINNTYFKGYGNWVPQGWVSSDMTGYATPFAEWPEEVKKYYTYDPEGAEALLDAAGLPRGADGIRFKTVLNNTARHDMSYHELASGYWREIGIQVEIERVDSAEAEAMQETGAFEGFWASGMARRGAALGEYALRYSPSGVYTWKGIADPVYDALYEAAVAAED